TVDWPEARNALSPAMYYGLRHAVAHCVADPEIEGLLLTGVGDMFIPGGDLGQHGIDDWRDFSALGMDTTPFVSIRFSERQRYRRSEAVSVPGDGRVQSQRYS